MRIIDALDYINLTALHLYAPLRFRFLIMRALLIFVPLLQRACIASLQQDCQIVITPKGLRKQNRQILRFRGIAFSHARQLQKPLLNLFLCISTCSHITSFKRLEQFNRDFERRRNLPRVFLPRGHRRQAPTANFISLICRKIITYALEQRQIIQCRRMRGLIQRYSFGIFNNPGV